MILPFLLLVTLAYAGPEMKVTVPPEMLIKQHSLAPFYKKYLDARGIPVLGSGKVSDYALKEAAYLIEHMLAARDDVRATIIANGVRFVVMAHNEMTTDLPEQAGMVPKRYWDKRARGLGATEDRPVVSCGEENLLSFPGDPYHEESVLIHEFGHVIHERGLSSLDPNFDRRLQEAMDRALAAGLWKGTYASTNRSEYWAEGVQSWFDTNRLPDHDHNHIRTRAALKEYDPPLAKLLAEALGDGEWRYASPGNRAQTPHLKGYAPTKAPRFSWPKGLSRWFEAYEAAERGLVLPAALSDWNELQPIDDPAAWRSPFSEAKTAILFVNRSREAVTLYWLDDTGARKDYGRIASGRAQWNETYVGHVFMLATLNDRPIKVFRAASRTGRALIQDYP